ncbi:hypothetical protein WKW50_24115 [Ochrobactrum sp. GPK 3]|uniref:hypothetical protein n=1 Tax=Brucella sp. 22210 TaxID=3453892 RepID=UPI0031385F5E
MENLLAQLIGGLFGGAAGGKVLPGSNMGGFVNMLVGAVGGVGCNQLLGFLLGAGTMVGDATNTAAQSGLDIATLAQHLGGGGVAGAVVQLVAGFLKNSLLNKPTAD